MSEEETTENQCFNEKVSPKGTMIFPTLKNHQELASVNKSRYQRSQDKTEEVRIENIYKIILNLKVPSTQYSIVFHTVQQFQTIYTHFL